MIEVGAILLLFSAPPVPVYMSSMEACEAAKVEMHHPAICIRDYFLEETE